MTEHRPVCFTCGHAVATTPFQNRLDDGSACPACRDRLLDEAPALLPRLDGIVEDQEVEVRLDEDMVEITTEFEGDDDPIGA